MTSGRDLSRRAVALFFALLLCAGLLARYDYSVDESTEMGILKSNAAEYVAQLFGEDSGAYAFFQRHAGGVERISQSIDRDHGISAYYAFLPALAGLNAISDYAAHVGWQCYTFALFMLGVAALYGIARELFHGSRLFSCAGALLLYLSPRMFAEGHYNNKDMVLLTFVLLTIWLGVRFVRRDRLRDALLFSLAGALATNTKIVGGWVWGVFGILYLAAHLCRRDASKRMWRNGLSAIGAFLLFYFLLTPAMWSDPIGFVNYLLRNAMKFARWGGCVLFEGEVISVRSGEVLPWYYLPKLICMTTPVPVLLFSAAGLAGMIARSFGFRRCAEAEREELMFLWAAFAALFVPLCVGMFSKMVLYNGWRHFYFFYAALMIFSLAAMCELQGLLAGRRRMKRACAAALAAYFACHGAAIVCNHPLQGSYYNPVAAPFVREDYDTDYWLLGSGAAVRAISACEARNPALEISCNAGYMTLNLGKSLEAKRVPGARLEYDLDAANYYIEMVMYDATLERMSDEAYAHFVESYARKSGGRTPSLRNWEDRDDFHHLLTLQSYGCDVIRVYERNAPQGEVQPDEPA